MYKDGLHIHLHIHPYPSLTSLRWFFFFFAVIKALFLKNHDCWDFGWHVSCLTTGRCLELSFCATVRTVNISSPCPFQIWHLQIQEREWASGPVFKCRAQWQDPFCCCEWWRLSKFGWCGQEGDDQTGQQTLSTPWIQVSVFTSITFPGSRTLKQR